MYKITERDSNQCRCKAAERANLRRFGFYVATAGYSLQDMLLGVELRGFTCAISSAIFPVIVFL